MISIISSKQTHSLSTWLRLRSLPKRNTLFDFHFINPRSFEAYRYTPPPPPVSHNTHTHAPLPHRYSFNTNTHTHADNWSSSAKVCRFAQSTGGIESSSLLAAKASPLSPHHSFDIDGFGWDLHWIIHIHL